MTVMESSAKIHDTYSSNYAWNAIEMVITRDRSGNDDPSPRWSLELEVSIL